MGSGNFSRNKGLVWSSPRFYLRNTFRDIEVERSQLHYCS